ncbi:MAG: serine/threonine-protein kinase [Candidatus Eremiobacteraeota bacterium]|nr:serine/threonine-protein kinase [Candidatus Eremiobacteraeota bacterium]
MADLLSVGAVLSERYEIKKVIGQGGMGAVYLASDKRLPVKQWAVKEMVHQSADTAEKLEIEKLFTEEAHHLATLDHPNLPRVADFLPEGDRKYLIMEYIEGETLEDMIVSARGPLPLEKVINYAMQLADVLSYLHNQKPHPLIFRDLKPSNIMITGNGRVKLIDFGIARIFVSGKQKDTIVLGTPGFAPPEQYGKSQTDQRSDIFSYGATVYYALSGEDPAKSPFHFPPLRNFNPNIPPSIEEVIMKCVNLAPESRFQSMDEVVEGFTKLPPALPRAVTTSLLALQQGADPYFDPQSLDFGILKRGSMRQMSVKIIGEVKGSLTSNKKWLKIKPSSVKGTSPVIDILIDTTRLAHGGSYMADITFSGKGVKLSLPVNVSLETQAVSVWKYAIAVILTMLTVIPALGFLSYVILLSMYYSHPGEERGPLGVLMMIASIISLLWLLLILGAVTYFMVLPRFRQGSI